MDVSSSSSSERASASERNQIIDEVRVRRSKGGRESGPYFIADTVHANLFVLDGSSLMFAPSQSFMKLGHYSPMPVIWTEASMDWALQKRSHGLDLSNYRGASGRAR